jgi:uncharacterized protein YndB with AHSA1/START domain
MTMQAVSVEPVRRTVTVRRSPEDAFGLFTDGISSWWPFPSHSIGGDDAVAAVFDAANGRLFERRADGTEHDWADILEWDPPRRFVLSWHPNPERRTEVEVRFVEVEGGTRLELEHRGWDRLGDVAQAARANYASGWTLILGLYEDAA